MESLFIYLFSFSFSAIIAFILQRNHLIFENGSIVKHIGYAGLIMFFPIVLSCFRTNIGIDYNTYEILFKDIHESSLINYISNLQNYEILNKPLVEVGYFIGGDNVKGVFALYAILTLLIYELSLFNFQNKISLSISTFVLLLILYSSSLNIVRQSLAVAIIFYSVKYIARRQFISFIVLCIVATGIHSSAIVGVLFYFLYGICDKKITNKTIALVILISPLFITSALTFLPEFALFERYFEVYETDSIDISASYILKIPFIVLLIVSYNSIKKYQITPLLLGLFLLELSLLTSASIFKWAFRLSYYPMIGQILLLGMMCTGKVKNHKAYEYAICIWYSFYFYQLYYIWGRDGIFPYQ